MALPSQMAPLGAKLPAFRLTDVVTGGPLDERGASGARGLLVAFLCNHCPYVVHVRPAFVPLANELVARGLGVVAINSNSERTHPQDGPAHMKELAASEKWRFPFLFDATQDVARAFGAACTPDFFLYDAAGTLVWRGRMDGSRPGSGVASTGEELRAACEAVIDGRPAPTDQRPSLGCGIKWHPS